ncbi:hypothetical protein [Austwickia chelonae]|uniref:hypothetical protein n=1 Tax=Austwickia chelonae TaxID=100225 RepID=UPI0013C35E78|nr:hypothetical protein [Austwickia chelonae]
MSIEGVSRSPGVFASARSNAPTWRGEKIHGGPGQGMLTQTDLNVFSEALGKKVSWPPGDTLTPMGMGILAMAREGAITRGEDLDAVATMFAVNRTYQRTEGKTIFDDNVISAAIRHYGSTSSTEARSFLANGGRSDLYA